VEANTEPEEVERVYQAHQVPHGYLAGGSEVSRREPAFTPLDAPARGGVLPGSSCGVNRPQGRLFSYRDRSRPSKVPSLCVPRQGVRVSGAAFRHLYRPSHLYQSGQGCGRLPENSGREHLPVSGRLVRYGSHVSQDREIRTSGPFLDPSSRVSRQREEVRPVSQGSGLFPRVHYVSHSSGGETERRSDGQGYSASPGPVGESSPHGQGVEVVPGPSGQHVRPGSFCKGADSSGSVAPERPLVSGARQGLQGDSVHRACQTGADLVDHSGSHVNRCSLCPSCTYPHHCHRCLSGGMGWPFWRGCGFWCMGPDRPHQCPGTQGCVAHSSGVSAPVEGGCGGGLVGQHLHCGPYQQTGGHSVQDALRSGPGDCQVVPNSEHLPGSIPHCGSQQCVGRCSIQGQVRSPHRVDAGSKSGQQDLPQVGSTVGRSVCLRQESSTPSVLLSETIDQNQRSQRSDTGLDEPVGVCIPSHSSPAKGVEQAPQTSVGQGASGSALLAEPDLVQESSRSPDRLASTSTSLPGVGDQLGDQSVVSHTSEPEVDCMALVRESYVKEGFSEAVADTAAQSCRSGTYAVYSSRLRRFRKWCVSRNLDPVKASVTEVTEFLQHVSSDRSEKPLAVATVKGYRSAIAKIHKGFADGSTVSTNRVIRDFLRGLFHVNAEPKPLPELWDLPLVLDYLAGRTFEPLGKAPFRNVARKAAFLLQLASARRTSWTQACHVSTNYTRIDSNGATLVPYFKYDKNQTDSYSPEPVFIPSLKKLSPDDAVHCPVRALNYYIQRSHAFRGNERALFIISKEPYSRASKQTISHWITSVIKEAYAAKKEDFPPGTDVRAHSTRGMATSWAAASGVSIDEIMRAAGWKTSVTFANHYLKNFAAGQGRFAATVLTTAAKAARTRSTPAKV